MENSRSLNPKPHSTTYPTYVPTDECIPIYAYNAKYLWSDDDVILCKMIENQQLIMIFVLLVIKLGMWLVCHLYQIHRYEMPHHHPCAPVAMSPVISIGFVHDENCQTKIDVSIPVMEYDHHRLHLISPLLAQLNFEFFVDDYCCHDHGHCSCVGSYSIWSKNVEKYFNSIRVGFW